MAQENMAGKNPIGYEVSDKTPPQEVKETGYECELVESPPKHLQSECPICLQILREPHIISCCGHSFCAACIERVGKVGKSCPLCNEPGFTTLANKGLKRTLLEFSVYCPHRLRGCEWMGELEKLNKHVNSNPQPKRQLKGCPFVVIECLHCKTGVRRDNIAGHQLERCPQRPYTCEYCTEYCSTFQDVANKHWPECKCFLLPCPNDCTQYELGIERQHLDQHVKVECLLTVVKCELHHIGCEVTLPRKDMADHMKEDSITHISLFETVNYQLRKRLEEREEQILLFAKQNTEQKEVTSKQSREINRLSQDLLHASDRLTVQSQELLKTKEKVSSLSLTLGQTRRDITQVKDTAASHSHLAPIKRDVTQAKDELAQTLQDLTNINDRLTVHSQELHRTKEKVSSLSLKLGQTRRDITQVKDTAASHSQLVPIKRDVAQAKGELAQTMQDLTHTNERLAIHSQEILRTKEKLKQTRRDITQVKDTAASHSQLVPIKRDVAQAKGELAQTMQDLTHTNERLAIHSQELLRTKEKLEQTRRDITQVKFKVASQSQLCEANAAQAKLELTHYSDKLSQGIATLNTTLASTARDFTQVKGKLALYSIEISQTMQELTQAQEILTQTREELAQTRDKVTFHTERIAQMNAEFSERITKMSRKMSADFSERIAKMRAELLNKITLGVLGMCLVCLCQGIIIYYACK